MPRFLAISEWEEEWAEEAVEGVAEDKVAEAVAVAQVEGNPIENQSGIDNMRCENESMRTNAW
jgi:hypothetical protein